MALRAKPKIIVNSEYYDLNFDQINDDLPLSHALFELLTNAFDAVGGNKDLVNIEVVHNNEVIITDQGPGIMRQHLRFSRTKHSSKDTGRFGIGLKDALSIIVNNNGNIKIESKNVKINKLVKRVKNGYDEETWHADIGIASPDIIGTKITVNAINVAIAIEEAKNRLVYYYSENLLFSCPKGEIYANNGNHSQYYRGVLTCEGAESIYTYNVYQNITIDKQINRDRTKLSKNALNEQIANIILKVPDDHPLLRPLVIEYKKNPAKFIDYRYAKVKSKLDNIIIDEQKVQMVKLPNGYSAVIADPTPKERKRLDELTGCTGLQYIIVSEFITNKNGVKINSYFNTDDHEIFILRSAFNVGKGLLAKHLGKLFTDNNLEFENDYPIRDVMVDIVETLT